MDIYFENELLERLNSMSCCAKVCKTTARDGVDFFWYLELAPEWQDFREELALCCRNIYARDQRLCRHRTKLVELLKKKKVPGSGRSPSSYEVQFEALRDEIGLHISLSPHIAEHCLDREVSFRIGHVTSFCDHDLGADDPQRPQHFPLQRYAVTVELEGWSDAGDHQQQGERTVGGKNESIDGKSFLPPLPEFRKGFGHITICTAMVVVSDALDDNQMGPNRL